MISFVYLDVGGVTEIDFSGSDQKWDELRAELGITPQNEKAYLAIWERYMPTLCTICSLETLVTAFRQELGLKLPGDYSLLHAFVKRFEPNPSIWPVVEEMKRHTPVGLLTNMWIGMFDEIVKAKLLPPVEWDVIIDSTLEGCQKPEAKIFEIAEAKAGVPGKEILFADNSSEHVKAAQKLGWQTFLYDTSNPQQASKELAACFQKNLKA